MARASARTRRSAPRTRRGAVKRPPVAPVPGVLEIVLATRNEGKLREFVDLMRDLPVQIYSLDAFPRLPELPEDGRTYTENAISKASIVANLTRKVAVADDSGIEVDALSGAPGPQSRRFLGERATDSARNARLLKLLRTVPAVQRGARYRAVVAVATPDGGVRTFEGICEGQVLTTPRGSHGFGYDPIFYVPAFGKSMAQLPVTLKNRISHRAGAFAAARPYLRKLATRARALAE
ncbi:MAG: RdgB/HAM1 family non-canonical purine NTP pyrophosphatase [Armatimonadetes bacterium]|nr:RdgB/HAM1 family non-canonical purine NTP pyrophosphatase [Armatimonadota bacterium]